LSRLVVHEGVVVLAEGSHLEHLSAMDIFRVAIRGAVDVRGSRIDASPGTTMPGITFRPEASTVGLVVQGDGANVRAGPAIRHRAEWLPLNLPEVDDHVLIGNDWYPLDSETLGAVRAWLEPLGPSSRLTAATYIELYRDKGPGFDVVDHLSDEAVSRLAGGSSQSHNLVGTLYQYQTTGLQWLSARAQAGLGGILADQMGLGKTLQIIGLVAQTAGTAGRPSLIVVPLTIVENWIREFRKFAPSLPVYRHVGSRRSRRPSELARQQVVITTYETAVSDEAILSLVTWDLVILDEAQAVKNPEALRTKAVNSIPRRAGFAVTGTPLENRTQDVWSISRFALPGYLGTREEFADRLETEPEALRLALRPLLLRREVREVAKDLPEKIEVDVPLEMFGPEATGYRSLIGELRGESGRTPILALITKLRLYTAHPDLIASPQPMPESRSAKLTRLVELLEEIVAEGDKTLVFVAFTKAADLVLRSVERSWPIPSWTLDGRTPVADRQTTIDQFSSVDGPAVLILNPAAGGVGLNIQAATHVVHYTLEWNPAREAQATARAYRRGQQRPVTVHRLYFPGTIDEFILDKLRTKQELFDEVITPTTEANLLKDLLVKSLNADIDIA
jgi:SNF2 family DNA or RNA helicase